MSEAVTTIEQVVREVLETYCGCVGRGFGGHCYNCNEAARDLAQRIERSWVELGDQIRHCHPESEEDWEAIGAATLAAFKGEKT